MQRPRQRHRERESERERVEGNSKGKERRRHSEERKRERRERTGETRSRECNTTRYTQAEHFQWSIYVVLVGIFHDKEAESMSCMDWSLHHKFHYKRYDSPLRPYPPSAWCKHEFRLCLLPARSPSFSQWVTELRHYLISIKIKMVPSHQPFLISNSTYLPASPRPSKWISRKVWYPSSSPPLLTLRNLFFG